MANPFFAYGAILVIQLRVIWNVWRDTDTTFGDTASYFRDAIGWAHGLHDNILWSPLYTNFFGTVVAVVRDVPAAVMVHRVAIVLAATVLVLALMRSLLPPALALLVTIWWALLPPNFNVQFEVHLFGLLPILVATLLVTRKPGRRSLGIAFAVLAGSTLLLRNELLVATVIVGVAIVVRELRERRTHRVSASTYARAYAVPLAIVLLLTGGAYWRSHVKGDQLRAASRAKHTLNVCQIYAFNYQQRHPASFTGNPFTECAPLMRRDFGRPMPTFTQAATANPGAIARFLLWNVRLLPSGLQVSLFGATSTGDNPDYVRVLAHRRYALALSVLLAAVLAFGISTILAAGRFWRRVLAPHAWAFLVLGSVAVTTLVVALTQRPRPEYLYGLTVGVMALTGLCISALLRRFGGARLRRTHALSLLAASVALVLCVALPSAYHAQPRPLHDAIERLQVVRGRLQAPDRVLVTSGYNFEICSYLAGNFDRFCSSPDWSTLKAEVTAKRPLNDVLTDAGATAIYADPVLHGDPAFARMLASPAQTHWRQVAGGVAADGPWSVLVRSSGAEEKPTRTGSVSRSGFEQGLTGWSRVDTDQSLTAARVSTIKKLGSYSLQLVNRVGGADDYYTSVFTGMQPSTTYAVSAWLKVGTFAGGAIAGRGLYAIARAAGVYDAATETTAPIHARTRGWIHKVVTVRTGTSDHEIEVRLYAPHGTTYWDGIRLAPAGSSG